VKDGDWVALETAFGNYTGGKMGTAVSAALSIFF
jgi:hypothetical protein